MPVFIFVFLNLLLNNRLCCDSCMVGSGEPKRTEAAHTFVPNENVFNRKHKRMTHMKSPRDVRWWKNYGISRRIGLRDPLLHAFVWVKKSALFPRFIYPSFSFFRIVGFQKFLRHSIKYSKLRLF